MNFLLAFVQSLSSQAPSISWTGPRNTLPVGRYKQNSFNTQLALTNIAASDEGYYTCSANNSLGRQSHTLHLRVEEVPIFRAVTDGPHDVNVTEGESFTFSCNVSAKPEAKIVWLQDGVELDENKLTRRFEFSNNKTSLTIRHVCRDCDDRESKTDLMVIQCNASNVHGYAFASGYLNVLKKTKVTIRGSKNESVDFLGQKEFVFQCHATSDPSTPPKVLWYKTQPFGDLVRNEPPHVYVENEFLIIMFGPECSFGNCSKYLGEYKCSGHNGYSLENRTITLSYKFRVTEDEFTRHEAPSVAWGITVIVGVIAVVMCCIGGFLCYRCRRRCAVKRKADERELPIPPNMYEHVGYDSADIPLGTLRNNDTSVPRPYSMYERIGYDSIDQVLEDMARRESAMRKPSGDNPYHRYESMDGPQRVSTDRGRPMQGEVDDMGYSEIRKKTDMLDQYQIHGLNAASNQLQESPMSTAQPDSNNHYSDLSRKDFNPNLDLGASNKMPKELNPSQDLSGNAMNPYLDLLSTDVKPDLNLDPKEMNIYLDMDHKHTEPYQNVNQQELDSNLDMASREMNSYSELVSRQLNQDNVSSPLYTSLREPNYLRLKN